MLTLKKVKEMVKAPVHTKRVPSPKVLLEDGRILLRKEFEHDSHLTLYHSGYVWFSTGKRNTVFHIHDCCGDYAYGASKGKGEVIKEEYFENCEWHIRALFEGEQRVEESQLKCEGVGQTKVCVSYHAVAEDWGEMADSEINVLDGLLDKMLADLRQIPTVAAAPYCNKVSMGSCPVCGNPVHESKLSFCCADRSCKFALWKESKYLSNMRKTLDKKMATDLLKKGRTHVKDFYSTKKDKTFAADLVMRVEDGRAQYSLEFPKAPMKKKT